MEVRHTVDISVNAIIKILLVLLGLFLIWRLQSIFLTILLAAMLAAALYPVVKYFNKKFSLMVSSVMGVLVILVPFMVITMLVIPSILHDIPKLLKTFDTLIKSSVLASLSISTADINQFLQNYLIRSTPKLTSTMLSLLTVTFLTLYILIDSANINRLFLELVPPRYRSKAGTLVREIIKINGYYIRGNLLISLVCFTVISLGLLALRVPYAVVLGLFAGIMDVIPLIGATVGVIPAIIMGFTVSPLTGILVIVLYIIYQQAENNIIIPRVYTKVLHLSASLTIISLLIGGALLGVVGAFIALPIAASIPALIDFINKQGLINRKNSS